MTKSKNYKNMDHTSAAQAKYLDQLRERNKKRQNKRQNNKTSLSRGGFR